MSEPTSHSHDDIKTAMLGRFDTLEVPIILEMLQGEGIFAMTKMDPSQPAKGGGYGLLPTGAGEILVEAACIENARRLVKERLPQIHREMEAQLDQEFGET